MIDLEKLKSIAEAATQGDWRTADCISPRIVFYAVPTSRPVADADLLYLGHVYCDAAGKGRANLEHVTAFAPPVALSLISAAQSLDELKRLVVAYLGAVDYGIALKKEAAISRELFGGTTLLDGATARNAAENIKTALSALRASVTKEQQP